MSETLFRKARGHVEDTTLRRLEKGEGSQNKIKRSEVGPRLPKYPCTTKYKNKTKKGQGLVEVGALNCQYKLRKTIPKKINIHTKMGRIKKKRK